MTSISRSFATAAKTKPQFNVFDRSTKLLQRSRTPKLNPELSRKKDYLRDDIAVKTIERLAFITKPFDKALDFGSHGGNLLKQLCTESHVPPQLQADEIEVKIIDQLNKDKNLVRNKIKELVLFDSSKEILDRDNDQKFDFEFAGKVKKVVGDEEKFDHEILQESNAFDLVVSNLSLHWINDLPQCLANINRILKPDGLFMGTLFGGDTLYELRTSLQLAELERKGGISPRVSPLVRLNDVGSLLNKAGFSLLTIDSEDIVVGGFPDIVTVCEDLQAMGEQNAVLSRANNLPKDVLLAANEIYKSLHGEVQPDGKVLLPATFNVIFMIGWKKSETQPQPLQRGTGEVNLKEVLQ
ncbi:hypothetical protein CORT_0B04340 [Candida orthopsilosis Co 90-125]|uniref:Methyltransferase type 11 domain-containing protein n=1 Tax=Candida orthopsilosis (strain 90-125) TaxID=1136231 RepID=H8X1A1_CANO9|nr:hypothetical protein CORT_0B04340 [Candida orthopsilosis Co 90-125]CCG22141.1 hypothetical protein CORT_0B04340 [Candida orthopsilosis Co 90-125]